MVDLLNKIRPHAPRRRSFPEPVPEEVRERVRQLWRRGYTYNEAAADAGVSRRTVARIVAEVRQQEAKQEEEHIVAKLVKALGELSEVTVGLTRQVQQLQQEQRQWLRESRGR